MRKLIYIIMICGCVFNSPANSNETETVIGKDLIKSLRLAAAQKDKKLLDKIALEMEKCYCCSPGHEKGFTAIRKSSFLIEQGRYKQAVDFINISLEKNKAGFNEVALNVAIILKGKAWLELNKFKQALKIFKEVENKHKTNSQSVPEVYWVNVLYCLATSEESLKNFSVALRYYEEFLDSYKKLYQQVPLNESYLYRSMGRCSRELSNYDKAYEYFQLSMNSASDEHFKAMVWGSLGATYQKQKKFLKAIECYDKSLEFFFKRETTFAKYIAKIYLAKAKAFIAIGQKDKALKCLDSALKISSSDILTEEINELISDIREN